MLPACVTNTFSGFRSRCTIPASCARTSARTIGTAISTARAAGMRAPASRPRNGVPSRYSSTMYGVPSNSSTSWMTTMLSWLSRAVVRASIRKRSVCSGELVVRNFIATRRPSFVSRASTTRPMPPRPSSRMTSYAPTRKPVGSWAALVDSSPGCLRDPCRGDSDRDAPEQIGPVPLTAPHVAVPLPP